MNDSPKWRIVAVVGPGLLVAATGVGAGDLATAGFTGSKLGLTVLWAALVGAFFKFVLSEGLTRWQLATGRTLLEGCMVRWGIIFRLLFMLYFIPWSFFVGGALISACGVTMHSLIPVFSDVAVGKAVLGILQSLIGVWITLGGGYKTFGRVMNVCIGVMFATVLLTAVLVKPDWGAVAHGLVIPVIPLGESGGLSWTVALIGGVGGTLTILCYGYWIREEGREKLSDLSVCRTDLGVGYFATALFSMAMVIIGSQVTITGKGAKLIVVLAGCLENSLGSFGRILFLVGAWGAVFSSLLGVWQAVPYIFADFCRMWDGSRPPVKDRVSTADSAYRWYLFAIAFVPMLAVMIGFRQIQKLYSIVGACFLPLLAVTLLILNGDVRVVGKENRNRPGTIAVLIATVVFFVAAGVLQLKGMFSGS